MPTPAPTLPPRRKGAARMADIPPAVRARLNRGAEETITLVEWLAIDPGKLAEAVFPGVLGAKAAGPVVARARELAAAPVTQRTRGLGAALSLALHGLSAPGRGKAFERLATFPADMVRAWAAYAIGAEPDTDLGRRLGKLRRFAADGHMAVRECAWDAWRPHVAADLARGLELLAPWVVDPDPGVRRCAIEGTRPRGVWTAHLEPLKADPTPGLALLEPVRSDPSEYVRRAVANWLNDASKSRPDWVRAVTARWLASSPTEATRWIVARGLRTLAKAATSPAATRGRGRRRASS